MTEAKVGLRTCSRQVMSVAAGILALAGILFFLSGVKGVAAANPAADIVYPVKDFQNGNARFYSYPAGNGVTIKYFIVKSSDGVIRAAFDACDVCFEAGKGYEQKGDFMVCKNCGRRFASVRVNEVKGGCNPAPLTRAIKGDKLIINVKDILGGKQYFAFGKGVGR
ncbi:MAG: DUF2318 domain-containing protein [Proteobacteria bacterium]|nr:DUF2318 domain-containing protein [Pseudomonadota bacterium]